MHGQQAISENSSVPRSVKKKEKILGSNKCNECLSKLFVPSYFLFKKKTLISLYQNTAKRTCTVWEVMKNVRVPRVARVELERAFFCLCLDTIPREIELEVIS